MSEPMEGSRQQNGRRRWTPRILLAILAYTLLAKQASAALSLAAWGVILAVVGLITAVAVVLTTSDNDPEIGAIRLRVEETGEPDWHVGQLRVVSVEVDVSFGHIRGNDVGVITLEVDFDGDVSYREVRRYTEKGDGDPDTETLGRWEGTITFALEVEAKDHGAGAIGARIIVDGERNGVFSDPPATVSASASLPVEVLYPLELQSGSGAMGWLSPTNESIFHHQCFDQTLQVRNRATVPGEIRSARIAHSTAEHVTFSEAADHWVASVTNVVTGPVGHEDSLAHINSLSFPTDWTLQGAGNIRVFLRSSSQWSHNGGTSPSSQSNTCQGGTLHCTLLDTSDLPMARNVSSTYALKILSRGAPPRAGSSRELLVSDDSGFSQIMNTDGSGLFSLSAPLLGPLVSLNPVVGSDSALFEPKLLAGVNARLFDSSSAPSFQTFHIFEREAPPIEGQAVDSTGNPMTVDLFSVGTSGEENYLGRFTGGIDIPGGLDLSQVGHPDAVFRVRPIPGFNRAYLKPEMEIGLPSGDAAFDLGTLVFDEEPPFDGPVIFGGVFEIRTPDGLVAELLAGLELEIEGLDLVRTDEFGRFEVPVPASHIPRVVRLLDPGKIFTAAGQPLLIEGSAEIAIEFGRGGELLDLGTVTLHSGTSPPEVPTLTHWAPLLLVVAILWITRIRVGRSGNLGR